MQDFQPYNLRKVNLIQSEAAAKKHRKIYSMTATALVQLNRDPAKR